MFPGLPGFPPNNQQGPVRKQIKNKQTYFEAVIRFLLTIPVAVFLCCFGLDIFTTLAYTVVSYCFSAVSVHVLKIADNFFIGLEIILLMKYMLASFISYVMTDNFIKTIDKLKMKRNLM